MSKLGEWFRRGDVVKIAPDKQESRDLSVKEKEQKTWENLDRIHTEEEILKRILELAAQAENNK